MNNHSTAKKESYCECGRVVFIVVGDPIITVACYCKSCQQAGRELGALAEAIFGLEADGSTHYVMCRKDKVVCEKGQEWLREHRLTPQSTTRRVVATCCNTPVFLEFEQGHWLSMYRQRFPLDQQPAIEQRTMTKDPMSETAFNDNIPSPQRHTVSFMWRLLKAWVKMRFKTPKVDYVQGTITT